MTTNNRHLCRPFLRMPLISFSLVAFFLLSTHANAQTRPEATAYLSSIGVQIDGKLNEPAWEKATIIPQLGSVIGSASPTVQTEVRLLRDAGSLYVGVSCIDPAAEFLQPTTTQHDGNVWQDDSVQIFIKYHEKDDSYYHFAVNLASVRAESRFPGAGIGWDGWWQAQAGKRRGVWVAEIEIPFASLWTDKPLDGIWGFNIVRYVARTDTYYSWATIQKTPHEPTAFGRLNGMPRDLSQFAVEADVRRVSLGFLGANNLDFVVQNRTVIKRRIRARAETRGQDGKVNYTFRDFKLTPGQKLYQTLRFNLFDCGQHEIDFYLEDLKTREVVFGAADIPVFLPPPLQLRLDRSFYTSEAQARLKILFLGEKEVYLASGVSKVSITSASNEKVILTLDGTSSLTTGIPLSIPLSGLNEGRYNVKVDVTGKSGQLLSRASTILQKISEAGPSVKIDGLTNGVVFDGASAFPIGVDWPPLESLAQVSSAGFNIVGTTFSFENLPQAKAFLDEAAKNNLKVFCNPEFFSSKIRVATDAFKEALGLLASHPALLAWNLAYQPTEWGVSPENLFEVRLAIKSMDPRHPILNTENWEESFEQTSHSADVLCIEPLIQSDELEDSITEPIDQALKILRVPSKPLWVCLSPVFEDKNAKNLITFEKFRCLTYLALTRGANGILFGMEGLNAPTAWDATVKIASEIKALSAFWLSESLGRTVIKSLPNDGDLHVESRFLGGRLHVVAINATKQRLQRTFELAKKPKAYPVTVLFENRLLPIVGRGFSDVFEPYAVHVYRVDGSVQ